jgi:hypothetical protein
MSQLTPIRFLKNFQTMNYGSLYNSSLEVISQWALDVFLNEHETHQADAVGSFYRNISGTSDAGSLQSYVFERQVLNYLLGIDAEYKLADTWIDLLRAHDVVLSWSHFTFQHQREGHETSCLIVGAGRIQRTWHSSPNNKSSHQPQPRPAAPVFRVRQSVGRYPLIRTAGQIDKAETPFAIVATATADVSVPDRSGVSSCVGLHACRWRSYG